MAGSMLLPPPHSTSANTHLPEIRVVLLGDAAVGKTSFLRQYLDHVGPSSSTAGYEATLLDSYTHIEHCGGQPYRVRFTDCSSAPEFKEHRAAYLAKCDIVIFVFSALHRKSLTSLRGWMKEVAEARATTGPARFASTDGDFSEVPIFVVGTHYGEKQASASQKLVSLSEAETVTVECLHSAGYFINGEDADIEEGLRSQRAAAKQEERGLSKKKQSSRALYSFFTDIFKGSLPDEDDHHHHHHNSSKSSKAKAGGKATKRMKKKEEDEEEEEVHSCTAPHLHVSHASHMERPLGDGGSPSEDGALVTLPSGASSCVPLYMLSNMDGEAVSTVVRVSLALYLWLKQLDYSDEVTPGMTPLVSPRVRSSVSQVGECSSSTQSGVAHTVSTPPAELAGQAPQHCRSVSGVSHVSERSAASFIPSMHALYGSVASLSAFDASYHHSRAASSGPLPDSNSPLGPGQPTQVPVAVGNSTPLEMCSSPGLEGKTSTDSYTSFTGASHVKGRLCGSPWCSPTVFSPGQVRELAASAPVVVAESPKLVDGASSAGSVTPIMKRVSLERLPVEEDAMANVPAAPEQEEQELEQTSTAIFVSSPPHPRRPTAPNTAAKPESGGHPAENSTTQCGEYSAQSGRVGSDSAHPLPAWATADTPAPRHSRCKVDEAGDDVLHGVWKNVDAEEQRCGATAAAAKGGESGNATDSVSKKLALEHEGQSTTTSAATTPRKSPRKSPAKSVSGTPSNRSSRAALTASAPNGASQGDHHHHHNHHDRHHNLTSGEASSTLTLRSLSTSPQSRELTHTHSHSQSRMSTPQPQAVSHSQTCPPQREEDELTMSSSLSTSDSHSRVLTKSSVRQKQKVSQCTTDGCRLM
ncbi:ras-like small GTPase [Lotmaria passim]